MRVATDVEAVTQALLEQARQTARGELGAMVLRVFEPAARAWPVDTGYSRSRLELRRAEGGELGERYRISVDAWYAGYIREKGKGAHVVTKLLTEPLSAEIQGAARNVTAKVT